MVTVSKTVSISKLKANMLSIFREIEENGEELIVTHHAKPVLRIIPIQAEMSVESAFAPWRGQVEYHAELDEPTMDEWGDV